MDDTDWTLISFEPKKIAATPAEVDASARKIMADMADDLIKKRVCPKCGRQLGKGGHFHVKACKNG